MRKIKLLLPGILLLLIALPGAAQDTMPDWNLMSRDPNADFYAIKTRVKEYFRRHPDAMEEDEDEEDEREGNELSYRNFVRWELFWGTRVNAPSSGTNGKFSNLQKAYSLFSASTVCQSMGPVASAWSLLGPLDMPQQNMGLVCVVEQHPTNPLIIYAGTNNSGLWKTVDGGLNWVCKTDVTRYPGLGIRDLLIVPGSPNTLYIATGTKMGYGIGILKSTDGGNTWNTTGLGYAPAANSFVEEIRIDPTNTSVLYAITNTEVHKTTDAGATWNVMLTIPANTCWMPRVLADIELLPSNPSVIFVSTVDPNACNSGSIMYRSTNGGSTWSTITPAAGLERIEMAVTPATPNKVFVLYNTTTTTYRREYDNSTSSWNTAQVNGVNIGFFNYQYEISPTDDAVRYTGTTITHKTTNGGTSWFPITVYGLTATTHADVRAIKVITGSTSGTGGANDIILIGTDGGVCKTTNGGTAWSNINGTGLAITQYYGIGNSDAVPDIFAGGTQDNGIYTYNSGTWTIQVMGDAYDVEIDKLNPQYMYACINGGANAMNRSTNAGVSWSGMTSPVSPARPNRPILMNEIDNALYIGCHDVYMCANPRAASITWTALSNFTTSHSVPAGDVIRTIAVAPSDPNYIYVAFENPTWGGPTNKKMFMTTNHGTTWTDIGSNLGVLQWTQLTDIAVDPYNPLRLWVTADGFWDNGSGVAVNKVLYSGNGGTTWTDYTTGLPDFPANTIVYEKATNDGMYVGTDVGVFYRNATMSQWECFSHLLPVCQVADLEINYGTNTVRAATHGRGIWESHLACPPNYDLTLSGTTSANAFREAQNKIFSTQNITGGIIIYRGGASVELNPGFTCSTSGYFKAYIHPCDVSGNSNLSKMLQTDDPETEESEEVLPEKMLPVKVYPNPNMGTFTVEFNLDGKEVDILLLDLQGKLVRKFEHVTQSVQVNATDLQSGIYPLIVVSTDNMIYHVTRVNIVH